MFERSKQLLALLRKQSRTQPSWAEQVVSDAPVRMNQPFMCLKSFVYIKIVRIYRLEKQSRTQPSCTGQVVSDALISITSLHTSLQSVHNRHKGAREQNKRCTPWCIFYFGFNSLDHSSCFHSSNLPIKYLEGEINTSIH